LLPLLPLKIATATLTATPKNMINTGFFGLSVVNVAVVALDFLLTNKNKYIYIKRYI
jgi:hypothetical protein